ncbi:MAG: hypothetical protein J6C28_00750 [Bacilli bacterium]|nr:hypothetical protein [Bacilli bacterium]
MEKQRQIKILSIIALVIAITGMSLGFAAFSSTLNISSSASVSPNSDDFKIRIYGINSNINFSDNFTGVFYDEQYYGSLTESKIHYHTSCPVVIDGDNASIDNSTHSIDFSVNVVGPSTCESTYYFVIKNEGLYDAKVSYPGSVGEKVCTALQGTTQELVDDACSYIKRSMGFYDSEGTVVVDEVLGDGYILKKGESVFFKIVMNYLYIETDNYTAALADGPFTIEYPRVNFLFSSAID